MEASLAQRPQQVELVTGSTFDGVPYKIALDRNPFDRGGSTSIRKGRIIGDEPHVVAVKVFSRILDPVGEKLLVRELRAARIVSLNHQSILGFLGTVTVGEQTAIVSFYMGNGNMMAYIKANPECNKKKLILQVAEAVEFLHGSVCLVHGDIKCTNVLISDLGDALLADFGLCTFAEKSQFATTTMSAIREMNTLHFAAPELLLGDDASTLSKTRESDVYAFGMLILEAMSEHSPWGMKSDIEVMKAICSYEYPPRPTRDGVFISISYSWWEICCSCWRSDPKDRSSIHRVLSDLTDTAPAPVGCRQLPFQERMVFATYTPEGSTIVAVTYEASIMLFDLATGRIRCLAHTDQDPEFEEHVTLVVSPDGRRIACCVMEAVLVLDAASGEPVTSLKHNGFPSCVAYSRDGTRIASGTYDGTVQLWDMATDVAFGRVLEGHTPHRSINDVSFSPDGILLASAAQDGTICLWDSTTRTLMATLRLQGSTDFICAMQFSSDGVHIVAGYDGSVTIWDVHERCTRHTIDTHWGFIVDVAFSPSGRYVASGSQGGKIAIWDVQDGKLIGDPLDAPAGAVTSVAFSPDGRSLVSTAVDRKVRVWDLVA